MLSLDDFAPIFLLVYAFLAILAEYLERSEEAEKKTKDEAEAKRQLAILEDQRIIQAENVRLKAEIQQLHSKSIRDEKDMQATLSRLNAKNSDLIEENKELKGRCGVAKEEEKRIKTELDLVRADLDIIRGENSDLVREKESIRFEKDELSKQLAILRDRQKELDNVLQAMESKNDELSQKVESLKDERDVATKNEAIALKKNEDLVRQTENLKTENKELKEIIERSNTECGVAKEEEKRLKTELDFVRADLDIIRGENSDLVREKESIRFEKDELSKQLAMLRDQQKESDNALQAMESKNDELSQKVESLKDERYVATKNEAIDLKKNEDLVRQTENLKTELDAAAVNLGSLRDENIHLVFNNDSMKLKNEELEKHVKELLDEKHQLTRQVSALQRQYNESSTRALEEVNNLPSCLKKYEFIRKIGEGGYGKIYLAKSLENGLFYAIKRISLKGLSEDELRLLNQESDVMAHLEQSDYLIKLIETFIVKDQELILVMEYAAGGDLYSKIQEHQISNEYFPEDQIVEWIYQAASGIYDMHKEGILHRDIKDENMFLTANEEIRIGDFGLCHVFEESGITNARAHSFIGTEIFMSPERLLNSKDGYDGRADVWALGVVLYELLTLKHPFGDADTSREEMNMNTVQGNYLPIPLHYSDQMFILVDGMLEKVPEYRLDIRGVLEQLSALREK